MTETPFVPHPHIEKRKAQGPTKVADVAKAPPDAPWYDRFNSWLAVKITDGVGTMWCAYAFALLASISLPTAIRNGTAALISWIAQTFLQLVLLSIIIVGQNIQAAASDKRAEMTYEDADAVLHTAMQIQQHLDAQDQSLEQLLGQLRTLRSS